jgi:hypothetical protein
LGFPFSLGSGRDGAEKEYERGRRHLEDEEFDWERDP